MQFDQLENVITHLFIWPLSGLVIALSGGVVADFIRLPSTKSWHKFVALSVLGLLGQVFVKVLTA